MPDNRPEPETFTLTFADADKGRVLDQRLRLLLKRMLRTLGFRAVRIVPAAKAARPPLADAT